MLVDSSRRHLPWLLLLAALIATTLIYWRGLSGPFLFDDPYALLQIAKWQEGGQTLRQVLFGNESLLMHRALSMGSFALNVAVGGDSPFSLKVGNLLTHLLSGVLIFVLLQRMFARDAALAARGWQFALLVTSLWLLHPLHVSTVLYIVQRMAQLAALGCLLGMWFYMVVRARMADGRLSAFNGTVLIWIGIPLLTLLAIQGKQNGAVLPALCAVLELAYFSSPRSCPRGLKWFFGLSLGLPAIGVIVAIVTGSDALFANYWAYDFGMGERLWSEARAMWVYIADTFAPHPPGMGIYADDFVVSRGWLTPATTLLAILGLLAMSALAIFARKRLPSLFAGWFLFLVGHAVESSILPLELYYEHRNYLPMVGLLVCAVSAFQALRLLEQRGLRTSRIAAIAAVGALAVLAIQTGGRVHVWQKLDTILASSVEAHPQSLHANFALLNGLIASKQVPKARLMLDELTRSPDPTLRAHSMLFKLNVDCVVDRDASPEELRQAIALMPSPSITLTWSQVLGALVDKAERYPDGCGRLSHAVLAREVQGVADRASAQPDDTFTKYTTRHLAARTYAAGQDYPNAVIQARLAWQPPSPAEYSAVLIRVLTVEGHFDEAQSVLDEARRRTYSYNRTDQEGLQSMQTLIDQGRKRRLSTP